MSFAELEGRMTAEDYLAWEARQPIRHEFVNGVVFAMVGASRAHARIVLNIAKILDDRLKPPCAVYATEVKVRVEAANAYYYPDVVATCDPADADPYMLLAPILMVEVLSPTTELIDRRAKKANYLKIPSLAAFVLVAQDTRFAEVYRRAGDLWAYQPFTNSGQIDLPPGVHLWLDEIYDRVPEAAYIEQD